MIKSVTGRQSVVGERWPLFWAGCVAISAGVLLHLPMLAMAHTMGNHLSGMPMDGWMYLGMALIGLGVPAAIYGALPKKRPDREASNGVTFEAPDDTPLTRSHIAVLLVLTLGLIIDTMKPATLGFVLPGMRGEYGMAKSTAALLPFVALTRTGWSTAGSTPAARRCRLTSPTGTIRSPWSTLCSPRSCRLGIAVGYWCWLGGQAWSVAIWQPAVPRTCLNPCSAGEAYGCRAFRPAYCC